MKKKYPYHYMWTNAIFETDVYKTFESELGQSITTNDNKFSMSQHLEVLMPEMAAVMKAGFDAVNTTLSMFDSKIHHNLENIKNMQLSNRNFLADALLQASIQVRQGNAPSESRSILSLSAPSLSAPSLPLNTPPVSLNSPATASSENEVPTYKMKRNLVTVTDLWREYSVGIGGGPSVKSLEENYNAKWRSQGSKTESRFYLRRLPIFKEIEKASMEKGITCEEAAQLIEQGRIRKKYSLNQVGEHIFNSMFEY